MDVVERQGPILCFGVCLDTVSAKLNVSTKQS